MKYALRYFGVFLLIGGFVLIWIGNEVYESSAPQQVKFGVSSGDSEIIWVDEGYIGGNPHRDEAKSMFDTIGGLSIFLGGVALFASFVVNRNQPKDEEGEMEQDGIVKEEDQNVD